MYYSAATIALVAAFVSNVQAHGVLLQAVGDAGKSQGFLVDTTLARNCTTISPCQQDSTIIRDSEIKQNIVNGCGRTEINGNIDIGEQTENELAVKRITQVSKGSVMQVTIHQVNADGAGPYECDLDETSNAAGFTVPLKVANNVPGANGLSQVKEQDFVISVAMPNNFNCIGASTGNMCTVRCRNTAVAGPFGGCFAVQQTDGQGRKDGSAKALISATAPPAAGATQAAGNNGGNNGNKGGNNAGNNAGNQAGNQGGNRNAGNAAGGNRNAGNQGNAAAGAGQAGQGQAGRGGNGRNQRRSQFFSRFLN